MKKTLLLWTSILAAVVATLYTPSASASHTMGADLTYECLGGNTYRVTLSFYRDCIGIAAPSAPFVNVSSASCGQAIGLTCYPRPGTGQEVTPSCSSSVTTCRGGTFTGIQEWVYDGIVNLPMQCTDWVFSYNLCCRNAAITNINTPGTSTFYLYATLNNLAVQCNNSPTFSNKPVPFLCRGQNYCFNHGAYDADGDSITFQLITPKQTASANVMYTAPFTASNPLTSIPATTFNSTTGDICMTPQNLEVTVMAVLVNEYRNGVLIGSVERDLQLTVMNCANNLPSLTGINGTNDFTMTVCANQPACFNIFSNDPDNGQQLTVTWDYGIPGATFTTDTAQHPTTSFCWTPTTADIGNSYYFTAMVADDACPYIGSQVYSYTINVVGIRVNAGADQSIACSDYATLNAQATGGTPPYQYLWSNGSTMQAVTVGTGTWTVAATDGVCTGYDTVNIDMPFIPVAAFTSSTGSCGNTPIQFSDQSTTPGGVIYSWLWNFGDGTISMSQNPTHQFPGPGTYNVSLVIENTLGCTDTVQQTITIASPPVAAFTANNGCINAPITFTNQQPGTATSWIWNFGNGNTSTQTSPTHSFTAPGTYTVTLIGTSAQGCTDTATQQITIYPNPTANAGVDRVVCRGTSVTLTASGGNNYTWTPGGSGQSITVNLTVSTNFTVTVTSANGCTATDEVNVAVNPLPTINAGADQSLCIGSSVTLTATGGVSYTWNPGNQNGSSITVSPTSATNYTVTGTSIDGCTATDIVAVSINPNPTANAGPDQHVCIGESATLTASGGTTYYWPMTGGTTGSISVNPIATTNYTVIATNANGCTDNDVVTVTVHEAPSVSLQSFFLCTGSIATLDAGVSGLTYNWSPNGQTTQTITINSGGVYGVTVTDAFGCTSSSTATVTAGTSLNVNLNDVSFCQGDSVVLDPGYPGMTYVWTPGGQTTQTLTVNTPGTYGVTVTDPSGCSGSVSVNAQVNAIPVALFSATNECLGIATQFTDASAAAGSNITNWNWNFGDGHISSQQNPSYAFSTDGDHTVELTVTSADGCTASYTTIVSVNPLPEPSFSAPNSCAGTTVAFTNQSTVASGNITTYSWNFGGGSTSTLTNPSFLFGTSGTKTVTLTATTAGGCSATVSQQVTVFPNPRALATANTVCEGATTTFTNTSTITSGTINHSWDFGDGTTSSQRNPTHTYATGGVYTALLTTTSQHGCVDTQAVTVNVQTAPVANAGADQNICTGNSVTLTATGGTNYLWSPGNQTTASITINPGNSTQYSVTVTDASGCSATDAVAVNILTPPVAQVSNDQSICSGETITLSGSGNGNMMWMPGGSTANSLTVQPAASTQYILTLTDLNGCSDQDTVQVVVNPRPSLVTSPDQTICSGSTVALTASGAATYSWFPGGSSNPTMILAPTSSNTFIVTGTSAAGCIATDTINITVNQAPVISLQPTFICQGFSATLDAGNTGSFFSWSTGETTQTISVSDSGNYSVVVTNPAGCSSLGATAVIVGGSLASFPTSNTICNGQAVSLNAGNPGSTYAWSTGETTQMISTTTAGTYYVTVTDPNGCSATMLHEVTVNPIPVVQFQATNACLGDAIAFTNTSNISSGNIQQISWDFGNGLYSSALNPSFTYNNPGTYNVSLTVTTNGGCASSANGTVTVHPLPVANFSADASCLGETTLFADGSSITDGSISTWNWELGDNTQSTLASPTHTFATAGNFNATLIVTSNQGCTDTINKIITIHGLPEANFTVTNECQQTAINLQNTSTSAWGSISNFNWTFGDGTTSTDQQPIHQFANAGTYTIELTTTTVNGCVNTINRPVSIYPNPVASFAGNNVCAGTPVSFSNTSSITSGSIYSNYWTFETNGSSSDLNPTTTFSNDGSYAISLVTTSLMGCRDTANGTITIHPIPVAAVTSQDGCLNSATQFTDNSTVNSGTITGWTWNFGDNSTSAVASPQHTFAAPGTYPVTLEITTNNGCVNNTAISVNIFPNPEAAFSTGNVCFGSPSQFVNQSSVVGGINFTSSWSFSDGTSSTDENPTIVFQQAGQQNATLTVTSIHGCTAQINGPVTVYNTPLARFATNDNCEGGVTFFTDLSTSQDGNIVAWSWNFGDGTTSTESDPDHQFANDGQFMVTLETTTEFGCIDTTEAPVIIFNQPEPTIQAMNACAGTPIQFTANTSNAMNGISYSWTVDNSTTVDSASFSQTFAQHGTHTVALIATSTDGCTGNSSMNIEIFPLPQPMFSANAVCLNGTTNFDNASQIATGAINTYNWFFGDGQSTVANDPNHLYTSAGIFQASLTATSDNGCIATVTQPVRVYANPQVDFSTGVQGCSPVLATPRDLTISTDGQLTGWLWDFGDGAVSTDQQPSHEYTTSGNYSVTLTVVSSFGCQSRLTAPGFVQVFPDPTADFMMSTTSVNDLQPTVEFTNLSSGFSTFQWNFGDGTTNNQEMNPTHTFGDTGTFSAMLITVNQFGCRDTAYKSIEVRPTSTLFAPNCFTPNGDGTNDFFKPAFTNMTDIQVWVFDRWGLLLKTFDGINSFWDGTHNGVRCQTDTYVYKIRGTGIEGKNYEWVGHVSIVY